MSINTNLWMDIYGCIFMRGLKTGYRARNSNKYVDDAVIQPRHNFATGYGWANLSTSKLDQDIVVINRTCRYTEILIVSLRKDLSYLDF